jgi:hypothetical protein
MCFVIVPAKKYNDMSTKSVLRRNMGDLLTANLFQKYDWGKQTKRDHITETVATVLISISVSIAIQY